MKKSLFLSGLFMVCSFFTVYGQEEETVSPYRYNKVYDYEGDTVVAKKFHVDSMLHFADKFIGVHYVSPGRSPQGFDCSGFTFYCFLPYGIYLPYTSHEQSEIGKEIPVSEAKAGDLLFFQGYDLKDKSVHHVALVVGKTGEHLKFIHSASHGVHYEYLDSPYYKMRFLKARRIY
jgi:lipoprotein Spr